MRGKKLQTFIFDFDGTLAVLNIDFVRLKEKLVSIAQRYIIDIPQKDSPLLEWLNDLTNSIKDENKARSLKKEALDLIKATEIEAARDGKLFDFTESLLTFLKSKGYNVGIVTRNCEEAVKTVFPQIHKYCHVFIPREKAVSIKPSPLHIHQAIKELGADCKTTMVIGDHPLDIIAGLRADTLTGGVSSGKISADQLKNAGAHYVADNCISLFKILQKDRLISGFEL